MFGAFILDPGTGISIGAPYEFFVSHTSSGIVAFDLSGLAGTEKLGLQFELSAVFPGDLELTSSVFIENVNISTVPEPGTMLLLGLGLIGLIGFKRRKLIDN